jgi:hypothetical protein
VTVMPTTPTAPTAATELARASAPSTSRAAVAPTEAAADAAPKGSMSARIRPAWVANQVRNSAGRAPRQNGSRTMRRNSMAPARKLISAALSDASGRSTTQHEWNHESDGIARHRAMRPRPHTPSGSRFAANGTSGVGRSRSTRSLPKVLEPLGVASLGVATTDTDQIATRTAIAASARRPMPVPTRDAPRASR